MGRAARLSACLVCALAVALIAAGGVAAGSVRWTRTQAPVPGEYARWRALAVAGDGSVSVAGAGVKVASRRLDVWTARYTNSGRCLWMRTWDDGRRREDDGVGVAVDARAYTYVCAYAETGGGMAVVLKYDPAGRLLWARKYQVVHGFWTRPAGVVVDSAGRIYVVGTFSDAGGHNTVYLDRLSSGGSRLWRAMWHPGAGDALAVDLACAGSGPVYVGAETMSALGGQIGIAALKVTADGAVEWVREVAGPAGVDMETSAMAVGAGHLALVGSTRFGGGSESGILTCMRADDGGLELVAVPWISPTGLDTSYNDVCVATDGLVYAAGRYAQGIPDDAAMVTCYDPHLGYLWAQVYDGPGPSYDCRAVAPGQSGTVYWSLMAGEAIDSYVRYPAGFTDFVARVRGTGPGGNWVWQIAAWRGRALYVAGAGGRNGGAAARLSCIRP